MCKVQSVIIAGTAHLKDKLLQSSFLDPRIASVTKQETMKVSYGGLRGLHQVLEKSGSFEEDIKSKEQQKQLSKLYESMSRGLPVAFGHHQVFQVHQMWASQDIFVHENLDITVFTFERLEDLGDRKEAVSLPLILHCLVKEGEDLEDVWKEKMDSFGEFKQFYFVSDEQNLVDWFLQNPNGSNVHLISESCEMGVQFVKGLEGICSIVSPERKDILDQFDQAQDDDENEEGDGEFL